MKKTLLLLVALCLFIVKAVTAQNTYVVNNIPGSAANYHSLQHALDSVPAGSIILLQNSGLNYGKAIINKPLVIYGSGYLIPQNMAPATQANGLETLVNGVEFDSGSQGSIVTGLHVKDSANDQKIVNSRVSFGNTSNIAFSRCMIESAAVNSYNYGGSAIGMGNCSNITIDQCFVPTNNGALIALNYCTGIMLSNNLITGNVNFTASYTNSSYSLINNTFYGNMPGTFSAVGCTLLQNNLIIVNDTAANLSSFNGIANNPFSAANHNITNVQNLFKYDGQADGTNLVDKYLTVDSLFLNYSNPVVSSIDGQYELHTNTVAKNFGSDGTDAGAYGGASPYVLSGIPAIPNIYFAQVPQTGTSNGGLKVHLKIQANN